MVAIPHGDCRDGDDDRAVVFQPPHDAAPAFGQKSFNCSCRELFEHAHEIDAIDMARRNS